MTIITSAEAWLVDIPVETPRTDAMQAFLSQQTPMVRIETADGLVGHGYTYTIGTGGGAVLSMLRDHFLPTLIGLDSTRIEHVWRTLYNSSRATSVGAITALALAAVDTALWDVRGLRESQALWRMVGGVTQSLPVYDTEGGWLHLETDELVASALESVSLGMRGVKIKIGRPTAAEDSERLAAVREAVGPRIDIMVDANQAFDLAEAQRRATAIAPHRIAWLEEPMPAEHVAAHAQLQLLSEIPIAVGESMYSVGHFGEYALQRACGVVQVDAARIGGITPWLKVAHLAEATGLSVAPHFLMELHVSLAGATSSMRYVEHIPQLRGVMRSALQLEGGIVTASDEPGLGIDWDFDALDRLRVA